MGTLLVQLARGAGGRVVAAARGAAKLDVLASLGAEVTVDYSEPDWTARVRAVVGAVDVVLDGAGGPYGRAAFDLLAPGGGFSAHGTPAGRPTPVIGSEFALDRVADAHAAIENCTAVGRALLVPPLTFTIPLPPSGCRKCVSD